MPEIEDFIEGLPRVEKLIVKRLRQLVADCDPRLQEKLSYGVPCFFRHRSILFLWPASHVPYGLPRKRPTGVTLGFCYGNRLSNDQGLLLKENRKQVYIITFHSLEEINEPVIREIIQEAILLDETFAKKKRK